MIVMINIVAVVIGGSVNEDVLAMIGIVDRSSSIAFGTCRSVAKDNDNMGSVLLFTLPSFVLLVLSFPVV